MTTKTLLPPEFRQKPEPKTEFVTIPERITHFQFGCSQELFEAHVKGQPLKVVRKFGEFVTVEVGPHKDSFNVHTIDLLDCKKDGNA